MKPHNSEHERHGADWQVTRCACGQFTVRLGALRVEFTREEFAQLNRMINDAAKRFEIVPGDHTASTGARPLTH